MLYCQKIHSSSSKTEVAMSSLTRLTRTAALVFGQSDQGVIVYRYSRDASKFSKFEIQELSNIEVN